MPLFLATYYLAPKSCRPPLIVLASYAFYGWWRVDYLALVIGISLVSYISGATAARAVGEAKRKRAFAIGVSLILAALCYCKYARFVLGVANGLSETFGAQAFTMDGIILPIRISFLSVQAISYIIEVARKDAPPASNLIDFLVFVSLFPELIAGPVLRYKDLADQFSNRNHSLQIFTQGVQLFVIGLAMKLLIADTVAPLADGVFALSAPTLAEAWLGALA